MTRYPSNLNSASHSSLLKGAACLQGRMGSKADGSIVAILVTGKRHATVAFACHALVSTMPLKTNWLASADTLKVVLSWLCWAISEV